MTVSSDITTVNDAFFLPIAGLVAASPHTRPCREFSDSDFLRLGIHRVLESSPSGRGFLQEHGLRFEYAPTLSNYFATLRSERRGELLADVHDGLIAFADPRLPDRLAGIPELGNYECFAMDGHWHQSATHDPRHEDKKMAVGHFYGLNLRTHSLRHLTAAEGLHEHDMNALKRLKPRGLRQGVPKGRRVLVVYDKAGVDLDYWKRCRQECAVYFLSRLKEGMVYTPVDSTGWDRSDPRNRGVVGDMRILSREGIPMRLVVYIEPASGEVFEFLTNEPDLPPGVLVELYRRRWEAEKVFDQIKNKLGETKAWGTSQETREAQARCVAITHNLLLLYETRLEADLGVRDHGEEKRRAQRAAEAGEVSARLGRPMPTLVTAARRATQRSVKFVRWVRQSLRDGLAEAAAVGRLRFLYATF